MTKEGHIKYWRESAQHDLESAESLFESKKFDWSLFLGHLVLEKTIKAIYVEKNDSNMPPKIHNLVRLAELSQIELDDKQKFMLDKITDFNIQTRYPDYKFGFYKNVQRNLQTNISIKLRSFING
jgi:HEPN domain-containing protein